MTFDIAIIGAGPGGYVAAIRAAQLGAKVVLIEKDQVGGICLNWGCIPSKSIIASVNRYIRAKKSSKFGIKFENLSYDYAEIYQRKEKVVQKLIKGLAQLIKANGIELIKGEARIESANSLRILSDSAEERIEFKHLIIATGSRTNSLPNLELDHEFILDSSDILKLRELPDSVLIVGSGAVGIEWARIFSGFDKQITLVEIAPKLSPMLDSSLSEALMREFKKKKINFHTGTSIEKIEGKKVVLSNGQELTPEIVFLGAGRVPNAEISGIKSLKLEMNGKFFKVDNNLKTSIDNVYAIGDVNGIYPLAHVASHQGIKAVEHILLAKQAHLDYCDVPFVIYGHPELASVGYTEETLIEKRISHKKSLFPMAALGKSQLEDEIDGFIKLLADDRGFLGIHAYAEHGSELIQQLAIAKSAGVSVDKLTEVIFAHPTYSEGVHESILGLSEAALHLPPGVKMRA